MVSLIIFKHNVSIDYAKGFENEVYATSSEASNKGGYYKAGDWTEKAGDVYKRQMLIPTPISFPSIRTMLLCRLPSMYPSPDLSLIHI